MNKVKLYQKTIRTQTEITTTGTKNKKDNGSTLIKTLKKIVNSSAQLKLFLINRSSCKNNLNDVKSFPYNIGRNAIDSNVIRGFITKTLMELDLHGKAKEDPVYARQMCDAVLASVYSNKKDAFCKKMISKGIDISGYLKEIGLAALQAGLDGKIDNKGIFIPAGAGANPFVTPLISSAQQKFPCFFLNKNQQTFFKKYAEKKILCEVGEICNGRGLISPVEFGVILDKVANRCLLY